MLLLYLLAGLFQISAITIPSPVTDLGFEIYNTLYRPILLDKYGVVSGMDVRGRPPGLQQITFYACFNIDTDMELFTVSCSNNRLLLRKDEHKQIVMNSLAFMVREERIWLYGYAIMEDEFHLLWKKQPDWEHKNVKQMLLKFTAQQIKRNLWAEDKKELALYRSLLHDRQFQFWEKTGFSALITNAEAAEEKIGHLHEAPVSAGLCRSTTDYAFSSASFYQTGHDPEMMLTDFRGDFSAHANHLIKSS